MWLRRVPILRHPYPYRYCNHLSMGWRLWTVLELLELSKGSHLPMGWRLWAVLELLKGSCQTETKTVKQNPFSSNKSQCSTRLLFSQFKIVVASLLCIFLMLVCTQALGRHFVTAAELYKPLKSNDKRITMFWDYTMLTIQGKLNRQALDVRILLLH